VSDDLLIPLQRGLKALGLSPSEAQTRQLLDYMGQISRWNKVYNLTAVRSPGEMLTHHILDSLAAVQPLRRHLGEVGIAQPRILDVGAGAGLPGVVLAILNPDWQISCVDTVGKKAAFIQQVAATLKLPNLRGVHARVEQLKAEPFDVVTSRAFASLVDFVALTRFHVKQPGGVWMAMKGKSPDAERAELPADISIMGVEPLTVPDLPEERCLVWMRPAL
jgi:16S rRNA (guanine527-N7)-methyltransferase